jgi:hypothetical protein
MKRTARMLAIGAMLGLVTAGAAASGKHSPAATVTQGLVLTGATIIDTRTGRLSANMTVVMDGGRIVKIVKAGTIRTGGTAQVVDASGKFLVPGYNDMHAHPLTTRDVEGAFALMIANGVTGFRQMGGSPELLAARRAGTLMRYKDAPELLIMPGTILTGQNARTPEAAIAEVSRQKEQGADFIKMVDVPKDAFFAAQAEANKLGLPLVGHLPPIVNVAEASRAGMHAMEHLGPREGIFLACSSEEPALRKALEANAPPMPPILSASPETARLMARALANPMVFTGAPEFARLDREIATFDIARCRGLAKQFIANHTWQVPTLIRLRTMEIGSDPAYLTDPNLQYVPRSDRELWAQVNAGFDKTIAPANKQVLERLFAAQLRLVKLLDQSRVPMLAGSDFGGGSEVPGFALHQEFDLLGQAGLSPLRILQMTTIDGARFLHREATMGSVAVGKDANLVLLDANPIASVANLHRVGGVVRGGVYYSPEALAALKQRTAERQK